MNIEFKPLDPKCQTIDKVCDGAVNGICKRYTDPSSKWRVGNCPMASHLKKEEKKEDFKLNPLKASKRSMKR